MLLTKYILKSIFTYPSHTWIELTLNIVNNITKQMPNIILISLPTEYRYVHQNWYWNLNQKLGLVYCSRICILVLWKGNTIRATKTNDAMKGDKIRNSLWQIPVNFEQTNTARLYHAMFVLKTIDTIIYVLFVPVNGRHLTYQLSFPFPLPQKINATNFACIWQFYLYIKQNKKLTFICAFFLD